MIDSSGNNIVKREREKRGLPPSFMAVGRNERALRLLSINTLACRPTAGRMKVDASDEVKWKRRYIYIHPLQHPTHIDTRLRVCAYISFRI